VIYTSKIPQLYLRIPQSLPSIYCPEKERERELADSQYWSAK
jgi:hypothetical protein